jgi:Holliday junction resolvase RusA-like endonuclease
MTASYNRKQGVAHVHHVQGAALAQWRASIRQAAIEAGAEIRIGPMYVNILFGCIRPKHHYDVRGRVKMQFVRAMPDQAPDLDKLVRAVLDALTQVTFRDDSQVVGIIAMKRYATSTEILVSDAWGLSAQGYKSADKEEDAEGVGKDEGADYSSGWGDMPTLWEDRSG